MNAVVAKDLRLASDALRPLAIVVGGVMLAIVAVSFVPASVAPSLLGNFDVAIAMQFIAAIMIGLGGALGAWITGCVLLGDRVHRAGAFEATVPISRAVRGVSKLIAITIACVLVLGMALTVLSISTATDRRVLFIDQPAHAVLFAFVSCAAGAAFATTAARFVVRREAVVALALAMAAAAGALGAIAALSGVEAAIAPLFDSELWKGDILLTKYQAAAVDRVALAAGGAAAIIAAAVVALLLPRGVRLRVQRRVVMTVAAVIVAASATGACAGWFTARADPNVARGLRDAAFMRWLPDAGDHEFVDMVERTSVAIKPISRDHEPLFRADAALREVARRVSLMSDTEFASNALARAVVNAARSGGPNEPRMRNALMFPEDRGLRFALEFASQSPMRESGWGYMAAWRLAAGDPAKLRALQQRFPSTEASQRFIIDQLEAAAAEGHPLAKELREAAANLRAHLAPPSDLSGSRP